MNENPCEIEMILYDIKFMQVNPVIISGFLKEKRQSLINVFFLLMDGLFMNCLEKLKHKIFG